MSSIGKDKEQFMADAPRASQQQAQADYAAALAQAMLPARPSPFVSADPYGRTLLLADGDFQIAPGSDGKPDLAMIAGKEELAQGIQVLVGTGLGSDIFNVAFGFDLIHTLALPRPITQMRELVRLCVVKALSQEPRIRQILAVAYVDEAAYGSMHPEVTAEQRRDLAKQQRLSRRWSLDVQFDTRLNDQIVAAIQGVGP
jgi:phage baseplate assembly protein W